MVISVKDGVCLEEIDWWQKAYAAQNIVNLVKANLDLILTEQPRPRPLELVQFENILFVIFIKRITEKLGVSCKITVFIFW